MIAVTGVDWTILQIIISGLEAMIETLLSIKRFCS